jgi:acetylornithine deacetylase/succinyl-diaminopimelate desuccinylase-like protein
MSSFMKSVVQQWDKSINWGTFLPALAGWVVEQAIAIQQIPAPTFDELARAEYVQATFLRFGLDDVRIDAQKNVYGVLKGVRPEAKAAMVMAHTDTVFPHTTDLSVKRSADYIYGAGLGDNSLGVAGMLGLLKFLHDHNIKPQTDLWFVATSCEEGLGDLKGVRVAYQHLKELLGAVINLEGIAFGHVYHAGIAVHRLHITANTEGGHSWLHFGRPSAIHALLELGASITRIALPTTPRTTYNIGMIEGGQTINSIASTASLWLDLRSESQPTLEKLLQGVHTLLKQHEKTGVRFDVASVGDRPAGYLDPRHPLVQGALYALELVGMRGILETGSTDGNIPLYYGCPCVTIGITRGGNAHRTDEFIEVTPIADGLRQLITLALATTDYLMDAGQV